MDADSEATRRACLDAAIRAFAFHGFARGNMRAIAEEAGVTASALYNYFPSKAMLYAAAWADALEEIYTGYEEAVLTQKSLVGEMHAVLDYSADVLRDRPWIPQLALRAIIDQKQPELQDAFLSPPIPVTNFYKGLVARAVERCEIDPADGQIVESFLVVLLWGISGVTDYAPESLDRAIEAAKWAVEGGFASGAGRRRVRLVQ